jgi:hypothetical protein
VLTHALEQQPRDAKERSAVGRLSEPSVEGTAPVERTAPLERPRPTPVDERDVPAQTANADVAERASDPSVEPAQTGADAERSARRAEDSTQPIVRERGVSAERSERTSAEPAADETASARDGTSRTTTRTESDAHAGEPAASTSSKRFALLGAAVIAVVTVVAVAVWVRPDVEPALDAPQSIEPTARGVDRTPPDEPRVEPRVEPPSTPTMTTSTPSTNASSDVAEAPVPMRGYVTVHATPWAEVQLDGRSLGTTPIRRTAIGAGSHVLVFENPPLGRTLRVPIRVEPGANVRVIADLSTDEPRARVR